jgi:hypothetical protein
MVSTTNARRHQPEHFLQGLRPGVQRLAGPAESVFRAAHWPPTARVTFGMISRARGIHSSKEVGSRQRVAAASLVSASAAAALAD